MGLDQYAFKVKAEPSTAVDFAKELENEEHIQIHYWRKHPNLHGWMQYLHMKKGGEGDFNCQQVKLTQEDIDNLASAILEGQLPSTSGFFFGESWNDTEEENDDLEFCKKASEAIKEGYTVYYDSWW